MCATHTVCVDGWGVGVKWGTMPGHNCNWRPGMLPALTTMHQPIDITAQPPPSPFCFFLQPPSIFDSQVHWVFGAKLLNKSVTLANASLNLMHEDPPAGNGSP